MKFVMRRLTKLLAASAGFALVASFAAAAYAEGDAAPPAYEYQAPQSTDDGAPQAANPGAALYPQTTDGTCFYLNYNPDTNLGQGSGASLGLGRLVCR